MRQLTGLCQVFGSKIKEYYSVSIEFDERSTKEMWLKILFIWGPISTVIVEAPVIAYYYLVIR